MCVISFVGKPQGRSTWQKVLARGDRAPLEVALVPDNEPKDETKRRAAERLGRPAHELLLKDSRSWHLRSWFTRSASTFGLVVLTAPIGTSRVVALTPQGFRPSRVLAPPDSSQELAVYHETGETCSAVPGAYRLHQRGQLTMFELSVPRRGRIDVRVRCASAAGSQLPVQRTLTLTVGDE